eukprot:tig00000254_g22535.t1
MSTDTFQAAAAHAAVARKKSDVFEAGKLEPIQARARRFISDLAKHVYVCQEGDEFGAAGTFCQNANSVSVSPFFLADNGDRDRDHHGRPRRDTYELEDGPSSVSFFAATRLVADAAAAGEEAAEAERRGADTLSRSLNACFGLVLKIARQHGGDCIQFLGDALLILVYAKDEGGLGNACAAALKIAGRLQTACVGGETVATGCSLRLRLHVAVSAGRFVALRLRTEQAAAEKGQLPRTQLAVVGAPFARLARCLRLAAADEFCVSPEVAHHLTTLDYETRLVQAVFHGVVARRSLEGFVVYGVSSPGPAAVAMAGSRGSDLAAATSMGVPSPSAFSTPATPLPPASASTDPAADKPSDNASTRSFGLKGLIDRAFSLKSTSMRSRASSRSNRVAADTDADDGDDSSSHAHSAGANSSFGAAGVAPPDPELPPAAASASLQGLGLFELAPQLELASCPPLGRALSLIPEDVASHILQGARFLAELKLTTVAFVHIAGVALPNDEIGTEDLSQASVELLQRSVAIVQDAAQRTGGILRSCFNDEKGFICMLTWGLLGLSHSDDPLRACTAALSIRDDFAAGHCGPVSIGVGTGRVFCGEVGDCQRADYSVLGGACNLAARLMSKADGEVWVDQTTRDAVHIRVLSREIKRLQLKGYKRGTKFYHLVGVRDNREAARSVARHAKIGDRISRPSSIASMQVERDRAEPVEAPGPAGRRRSSSVDASAGNGQAPARRRSESSENRRASVHGALAFAPTEEVDEMIVREQLRKAAAESEAYGRAGELEWVSRFLLAARCGSGAGGGRSLRHRTGAGVLFVEADVGMGKSVLLAEALRMADAVKLPCVIVEADPLNAAPFHAACDSLVAIMQLDQSLLLQQQQHHQQAPTSTAPPDVDGAGAGAVSPPPHVQAVHVGGGFGTLVGVVGPGRSRSRSRSHDAADRDRDGSASSPDALGSSFKHFNVLNLGTAAHAHAPHHALGLEIGSAASSRRESTGSFHGHDLGDRDGRAGGGGARPPLNAAKHLFSFSSSAGSSSSASLQLRTRKAQGGVDAEAVRAAVVPFLAALDPGLATEAILKRSGAAVFVDDLFALDALSLTLLCTLSTMPHSSIFVTTRPIPPSSAPAEYRKMRQGPRTIVHEITPFALPDEARGFVAFLMGVPPAGVPAWLAEELAEKSNGNPFVLSEFVEFLDTSGWITVANGKVIAMDDLLKLTIDNTYIYI